LYLCELEHDAIRRVPPLRQPYEMLISAGPPGISDYERATRVHVRTDGSRRFRSPRLQPFGVEAIMRTKLINSDMQCTFIAVLEPGDEVLACLQDSIGANALPRRSSRRLVPSATPCSATSTGGERLPADSCRSAGRCRFSAWQYRAQRVWRRSHAGADQASIRAASTWKPEHGSFEHLDDLPCGIHTYLTAAQLPPAAADSRFRVRSGHCEPLQ
jgi:hypothetical protein